MNRTGVDSIEKVQPKSSFVFFDDRFVFDRVSGMFFAISEEAALILRSAWEGLDRDDIRNLLMQRFEIERGTAIRDTEQFLGKLKELGLLPPTWRDRS
ncbi:PqqD family peptide modification chaperone [Alkalilacustris brevis]|uniref:PqqD family peptide modification chaperone n=1 Tax=Alkalilacustris brevis TaxID=2026338 RepID=UPI00138FAE0A|nr:PqqD family peptide modification chaperone [Alkalilacustris brevis]